LLAGASSIVSEPLTNVDVRVLGSLIEKERTTPEYYPLSLNALVTACNQSSNRDPVVSFDEGLVARSIEALRQHGLIRATRGIDARVTKYGHRVGEVMGLSRRDIAVLCVLMLRGAQTPGELRTRTGRLETFENIAEIEAVLDGLIVRELVVRLPRQPGQKEVRYTHLLTGEGQIAVEAADGMEASTSSVSPSSVSPSRVSMSAGADRLAALEETVDDLKKALADLQAQFATFRAQFE
jgi:uncharacterized protein YceH (UPF0502 family)